MCSDFECLYGDSSGGVLGSRLGLSLKDFIDILVAIYLARGQLDGFQSEVAYWIDDDLAGSEVYRVSVCISRVSDREQVRRVRGARQTLEVIPINIGLELKVWIHVLQMGLEGGGAVFAPIFIDLVSPSQFRQIASAGAWELEYIDAVHKGRADLERRRAEEKRAQEQKIMIERTLTASKRPYDWGGAR